MRRSLVALLALSVFACRAGDGAGGEEATEVRRDVNADDVINHVDVVGDVENPDSLPDDAADAESVDAGTADTGVPPDVSSEGDAPAVENPGTTVPPAASATRRLTTDMLQASIPIVLGTNAAGEPITWELGSGRGRENGFDRLSDTLGRPDFSSITEENRAPTALYIKLMEDMALDVCVNAVEADYRGDRPGGEPVLVRFAELQATEGEGVDANLRYLLLRFLSASVPTGEERLDGLRAVFLAGAAADADNPAQTGWTTVCVALLTHPTFHLY